MTPYQKVYDAFLVKMLEDEWVNWTEEEISQDLRGILEGAISWFKFPRISLDRDDNGFINDLDNEEIQILACYMKCEWLNRTILTWENVKPLYEERDSPSIGHSLQPSFLPCINPCQIKSLGVRPIVNVISSK